MSVTGFENGFRRKKSQPNLNSDNLWMLELGMILILCVFS